MFSPTKKPENKSQASESSENQQKIPSISLPKGGGAIHGIGEKFSANPVTGTGSLSIPIFTTPGRSGFGPQLSLSYDSGSGNGPFGFGWSLSLPSITRKTDKGLPKYQDAVESDVFILSGAEDLVPVFKKDKDENWIRDPKGNLIFEEENREGYNVRHYRPRIEGLFARIERWTLNGDTHWRSISKDNILTVYGRDKQSRVYDPADESKIFSWLISESYDDKGNAILYEYVAENSDNIDISQANEQNRVRTSKRYLKRIKYGNLQPLLLDTTKPSFRKVHTEQTDFSNADWMFELVFDYEEGHYTLLPLDKTKSEAEQHQYVQASVPPTSKWSIRPDPFSNYRAGFEVRTYRRCHRILMFHSIPDLSSEPYLVRSTEFEYSDLDYSQPVEVEKELEYKGSTHFASFIQNVTQSGYVFDEIKKAYLKKSLPSLDFEYSHIVIQEDVKEIDPESLENLPYGLDGTQYQWVDLDGEGISGILTEQAEAWFYKPNMGDGKFGPMEKIPTKPSLAAISSGRQQLMDLAGDGQLDLVLFEGSVQGFYERTFDQGWENFTHFTSIPNVNWKDPNLKFIDLDGDGHADILIAEDNVFTWYPSLAKEGFGQEERVYQTFDEEKGPHLVFDDGTQSIYLADMSGDGLTDIVRIRNGEVCYWPNLCYCRFGAKVTMDNSPWFDSFDLFDQKRIRLADVDGSGTTDIIYLKNGSVEIYFNRSGNSLSEVRKLSNFPLIDNLSSLRVADLFGNGTACLIWSSPLTSDSRRPMRYIDLMGGQKPHLLTGSKNNLGMETKVTYAASTKFYLDDKINGNPWITRIPFPVYVIERVETYDRISRNRFVTRYAYHHGYFDGIEREFRGFGMVEQWDTEEIGNVDPEETDTDSTNWDAASFVPPVLTRTWFHTGAYFEEGRISKQFEDEYYREGDPSLHEGQLDPEQLEAMLLPDTILPDDLTADETREACRSLKGSILRQEVYALDRHQDGTLTEESDRPYTVSERNYTIKYLQPQGGNKYSVFFVHPRETIDFHYERKLYDLDAQNQKRADPRVTHNVTLEVDPYGNVLKSMAIGYGRRLPDSNLSLQDQNKQSQLLITYTENSYTNPIPDPKLPDAILKEYDAYRTPLQSETRTFEVIKFEPQSSGLTGITNLFRFEKLEELVKTVDFSNGKYDIPYEDVTHAQATDNHPYRRPITHMRVVYRSNQLNLLQLGSLESLALPGETYKLAFTTGLLKSVYQRELSGSSTEDLLPKPSAVLGTNGSDGGGYVDLNNDGNWWIPSGKIFYSPNKSDTCDAELTFACKHFFLPHRFCDPFGNNTIIYYDSNENDPAKNYNLLLIETQDALGNCITAENDYRVLQPKLITDPNGNRSAAAFDAFDMVVGTAVMGKVQEPDGKPKGDILDGFKADITLSELQAFVSDPLDTAPNLLSSATSRIIYDVDRFLRCDQPIFAATLTREMHQSDSGGDKSPIQISVTYSDGFGREIQTKIQAEPGDAPQRGSDEILPSGDIKPGKLVLDENGKPKKPYPHTDHRWVGKGRTVYNNKGKPVKQYEPFFSSTHLFEEEPEMTDTGVTPVLFYDPVERVVATLHPNHTYEKVVFDPWHQETYDVNDTVTGDPRTDTDISGYVAEYFKREAPDPKDWKTWLQQRNVDPLNPPQDTPGLDPEKKAAVRTLPHANTPIVTYFDTLGRTFLTIANNGKDANGKDIFYKTYNVLDIEGHQRQVIDAKDRIVMRYDYDMLGNKIHQASMEAGERWMLNDVTGKPIRAWDSRNYQFRTAYDQLRRPTESYMSESAGQESLVGRTIYGEIQPNPEAKNLRGKAYQVFDQAGVVTNDEYDFKGNLLRSHRQLAKDYKNTLNWPATLPSDMLEDEIFTNSTTYDALNRPIQVIAPHSSKDGTKLNVIQPIYNEANLLEREDVWLEQNSEPNELLDPTTATQHTVKNIDYNAKGQRELIEYGNEVITTYEYDPLTFRLIHLETLRSAEHLQDLFYTYDPTGNIIVIRDNAQQTIYFNGQVVKPDTEYWYDAIYRLIEAAGREHIGQASQPQTTWNDEFRVKLAHPNDGQAIRNYFEFYKYDEVGNFLLFDHKANNGNWTRSYEYNEKSQTEAGKNSNRLSRTVVSPNGQQPISEPYTYDIHGNMISMPHLPAMSWDFKDELQMVDKGGGCKAYYVYDSTGQRVHKVIEQNDKPLNERIYIGGYEVYRKYDGSNTDPVLERESLHIMDDKQRIALVDTKTIDTNNAGVELPETLIRYQFSNHLGSATLELDENADVISYEEYYPYGSTSYQAVRSKKPGSVEVSTKRYRYTGKERDEETGLYYYGVRYYAPWLGKWTSSDPIGIKSDLNLYTYVRDNPIRLVDPDGRQDNEQQMMMGMMWDQLGQEISGIIEGFFGGKAYVNPSTNQVLYSGPQEGVGGVVGGVVRAGTLRAVPIEKNPSPTSLVGLEAGAGLVPLLDPGARLVTGTTVTGLEASRSWAAIQFASDALPFALEAHAASIEARMMSVATEESGTSVSLAFRPGFRADPPTPIGHNMIGINAGTGTEWSHLVVGDPQRTSNLIVTGGDAYVISAQRGPGSGYSVIEIPVSQADATRAAALAQSNIQMEQVGRYGLFSQDCTTYASSILDAAGVFTPKVSTPALNYLSVALQSPAAIVSLRTASAATTVTSIGFRATYLERTLQQSIPGEHSASQFTYEEERLQQSIPSEHQY